MPRVVFKRRSGVSLPSGVAAGGAITPSLFVEYVDISGNYQRTAVAADGSTSISGYAPFLVHFDARTTRSAVATGNSQDGAWLNIGHAMSYGEARGTSWAYPINPSTVGANVSRDFDYGQPIFGHVYEVTGTHLTRYRCRDSSGNEATVSLSVTVSNQTVTRTIPTSDGAWGTIVSGGRYLLNAGSDYTSFGILEVKGLHNVLFQKTGSGADPIISGFRPGWTDGELSVSRTQTRHVRTDGIDVAILYGAQNGWLNCGVVNGRLRRWDTPSLTFAWGAASSDLARSQINYPKGTFLYNCGQVSENDSANSITLAFWSSLHFHAQGVDFFGDNITQHILRNFHAMSSYRNCRIWSDAASWIHPIKQQAIGDYETPSNLVARVNWDEGPTDSRVGTTNARPPGGTYPRACDSIAYHSMQLGSSSGETPRGSNIATQNNLAFDELMERITVENSLSPWTSIPTFGVMGRQVGVRQVRADSGSGAYATAARSVGAGEPVGYPPAYDGPFINETINTRPVPTAF
jgi:hypothetical protein